MWPSDVPSRAASYWKERCNLKPCPLATAILERYCGLDSGQHPKLPDQYIDLQGIFIFYCFGGCTDLGFTSLLVGRLLTVERNASSNLGCTLPSRFPLLFFLELYNSFLSTHTCVSAFAFIVDIEATFDICQCNFDIDRPTYTVEIDYPTFINLIIICCQIIQIIDSAVQL